ncbi:MAG: ribonuclease Y [Polyangiales bacterium]
MTPLAFLIGAAAGAAVTRLRGDDRAKDSEASSRRAQDAERERDGLRARVAELDASLAALRDEAEALRKAAAQTLAEAQRGARVELREAVEAELRGRVEALEADARARARQIVDDARDAAHEALAASRQRASELDARDASASKREAAAAQKDVLLTQRDGELSARERAVAERERAAAQREAEAEALVKASSRALDEARAEGERVVERAAGLTAEDAKAQVLERVLDDARRSAAREAKQIEDLAREEAERRAKRVIGIAVQRYAGEYAGERAVTSVALPSDELKGRIIGREGRNIRAFQEVTGCDLVIDDTPETIVVSSFDPVRREMARITLERLVQDGRIHPTKIEELFSKAKDEVERTIRESGDAVIQELGVGRMHPDLVKTLGQLRYRYSYAQNILRHSAEVGHLCGLLAGEMGLNVRQARRAGLLHDIGKAATHEMEGGHAVIGAQFARKGGEDELVVNAIASHHDDEPPKSVLAHLTAAADAISGARPGARREMLESYVRRLEDLEKICAGFKGVERSFAIQAGREVRVLVEPGEIDDLGALALSREIARKIEDELAYPGQIRVTVVRETRAVDYAR